MFRSSVVFVLIGFLASFQLASGMGASRSESQGAEVQYGRASWYGSEQGHRTASGERFDEDALTAAHRRLPFGTIVRVTNELNGRSVKVRINDRGPWTGGRVLDVTSAAADILQMKTAGIVPVKIEVLQLGSPGRSNEG
jgi:rare lipoprotein A